ncbi:MAG: peptidyl-prolyl cis-trans isomerase, partial [Acidimicrobiia bacterium]
VLVKVNGEIITKTDLEARQVAVLRQRKEPQRSDEDLAKAIKEITPQVLVDAIDELLLIQRARELDYRLSDDEFRRIIENIKKDNKLETEEQFQAALKQENMTMADLRRSIERQVLISRVQQAEVFGRIGITEEEAKQYYEAHQNEFTTPASVTLREILVSTPAPTEGSLNVGADEAAKQKAEALRARVVGGEDFAKMAAEVSDAPSKANGGLIGPLAKDELAPDLRDLIGKIKVGEVTDVIRTPRGYQIFKVESVTDAVVKPFAEAREEIAERVVTGKRRAAYD